VNERRNMKPYRNGRETPKLKAMIARIDRLLAGKVPRGAKGPLRKAKANLRNALAVYEARDREAAS